MRISTSWMQQQSVSSMMDRQAALGKVQAEMGSGKRINTPSDDPVGAARALDLTHLDAQMTQYQRNIGAAQVRLGFQDQTLSTATDALRRARTLMLEGMSGSQTDQSRADLAAEIGNIRTQLLGMANGQDTQGDYVFGGNRTSAAPFSSQPGSVSYIGDDGQRQIAAGPGVDVASNDPGNRVFMDIPTGNGTYTALPQATNSGSGVVGANSVTDYTAWDGGTYQVAFTAPTTYEVRDSGGALVTSGSYDPTLGSTIAFKGIKMDLRGAPATGDQFTVAPAGHQDIFATLDQAVQALKTPGGGLPGVQNTMNQQLANMDRAMDRWTDLRSSIGARLNTLDQQSALNSTLGLQYKTSLSATQDLDYYDAVSRLTLQTTALQAAQATFSKLQGLSLFNYLK